MPRLLIRLTKRNDGGYVIECARADGSVTWQKSQGGKAQFFPLHDLTHYAVETELRHRRGFYGLLAEGWDFDDFGKDWGKRPYPADAEPSELIVGMLDVDGYGVAAGGTPTTAAEINASARTFLEQRGAKGAATEVVRLTDDELSRIRQRLHQLREQWDRLPFGQTLELPFDVK